MRSRAYHQAFRGNWRRQSGGLAVSLVVHLVVMAALAQLVQIDPPHEVGFAISSAWQPPPVGEEWELLPLTDVQLLVNSQAGGSDSTDAASGWPDSIQLTALPVEPGFLKLATTAEVGRERPSRASKNPGAPGGRGNGHAVGDGPGRQPGFFGLTPPDASRVVFVVDCSRSMNHPHDSELKTRFRRVKFELLKCISEMQPTQSFFVIFFSNEMLPMPATALQPAQSGSREPYLRWIGSVPSGGSPTDPRDALALALRMQPDVICFLTDGEFPKGISRQLMSIRQDRTAIHTFAFGDTLGEETLKTLAHNNRGEYRFVP